MKKLKNLHPGFQLKFSSSTAVGAVLTVMVTYFVVRVLNDRFHVSLGMPIGLRMLISGIIFGVVVAIVLNSTFIKPLMTVAAAMRKVAEGDFGIQLECKSNISDIKEIYTSFNAMAKALSETETLQTDFVSNVSHEFKTPINAIEGYASLLQDSELPHELQAKYVDNIIFNTRRLSTLTGNILLLSKLNNQSIRPQKTRFRLDEQVRQAILALEQKWTEKELEFDVELDKTEYSGYENLLVHVWTNLIDNAVKFTPAGSLIRMRLQRENDELLFTIEDSGPGIPEGEQERIFAKFYQSETSREVEGNGLGLALVRQIVEISGGSVTVENLPEAGCRFAVRLPEA